MPSDVRYMFQRKGYVLNTGMYEAKCLMPIANDVFIMRNWIFLKILKSYINFNVKYPTQIMVLHYDCIQINSSSLKLIDKVKTLRMIIIASS